MRGSFFGVAGADALSAVAACAKRGPARLSKVAVHTAESSGRGNGLTIMQGMLSGAACICGRKARYRQYGNVVLLAEMHCGVGNVFCRGFLLH
jgi:hypothetical protein